jgi:5'-nucleotidase
VLRHRQNPFDLVVSGINLGLNAGVDVFYSGTVAGALEGALHGIGSVAVSTARENAACMDRTGQVAAGVIEQLCGLDLPEGWLMNLNIPELGRTQPPLRYTHQSPVFPAGELSRTDGTRGRVHYWLDQNVHAHGGPDRSDVAALADGCISVTPLARTLTDRAVLERLQSAPEQEAAE